MKRVLFSLFLWTIIINSSILYAVAEVVNEGLSEGYSGKGMRDPFVPLLTAGEKGPTRGLYGVETIGDIEIEGLVFDPNSGSMVIVNGVLLEEGAEQDGVRAVRILENGVEFMIHEVTDYKEFKPNVGEIHD